MAEDISNISFVEQDGCRAPRVSTAIAWADRLGSWKARWGIGRMAYAVEPGLYAVGDPDAKSRVFVSANYKMSFDRLRSNLAGRDGWILVLDTMGINVWCAAGKGTFGTDELVNRIEAVELDTIVSHRTLVVPQLGATGVCGREVKDRSGFSVVFGPVRAEDLPEYLDAKMRATSEMRRVRFPFWERVVLIPLELVMAGKSALFAMACLFILSGMGRDVYSVERAIAVGLPALLLFLAGGIAGAALTPALLPWIPGRSFSAKGAWVGFCVVWVMEAWNWCWPGLFVNRLDAVAWALAIPAVSSFLAMNFTGASTYTSLSGVRREMRVAIPLQAIAAGVGLALWIVARFVG